MPRNVRNFWIAASVDGREAPIGSGPKAKDGGFLMNIYQRDKGRISDKHLRVYGYIGNPEQGKLVLDVDLVGEGGAVLEHFGHVETLRS